MCAPQREHTFEELVERLKWLRSGTAGFDKEMTKVLIDSLEWQLQMRKPRTRKSKWIRAFSPKPHWTPVPKAVWVGYQR
jgi:hypothetical protein